MVPLQKMEYSLEREVREPHNATFEKAGELDALLYSCHSHQDAAPSSTTASLTMLIVLFLGGLVSNIVLLYVLRRYRHVIERVLQTYCYGLVALDLMKVFLVVLPAIIRLCGTHALSGDACYAGYYINLFLLQSSLLLLALAAYDRVMVLRKSEDYGRSRQRWKHILLIAILIPLSYMTFDVVYAKIYEANSSGQHASEQNSLCYDQKLGWCMTKGAPHEHEKSKELDLSGSKKAGVFICQAHIMTVLMLIALVTMQSGHSNYKKMYTDESKEGCYYLMILTLNVWLYLPAMLFILLDTFTASIFPTDYYEQFYIYLYITPLMPAVMNSFPLLIAYRDYIFNGEEGPPKHYQSLTSEHKPSEREELDKICQRISLDKICQRVSRLEIPLDFSSLTRSPLSMSRSPLSGGSERTGDKDYFDKEGRDTGKLEMARMLQQMCESLDSIPSSMSEGVIANPVQGDSQV